MYLITIKSSYMIQSLSSLIARTDQHSLLLQKMSQNDSSPGHRTYCHAHLESWHCLSPRANEAITTTYFYWTMDGSTL